MSMNWHEGIFATHEEAQDIAAKPYKWPGDHVLAVALPSRNALNQLVQVRYGGRLIVCSCLDLGPWCRDDDDYVFGNERPRAEIYKGKYCPIEKGKTEKPTVPDGNGGWKAVSNSNGAGIDLFPGSAKALHIPIGENVKVDWSFV